MCSTLCSVNKKKKCIYRYRYIYIYIYIYIYNYTTLQVLANFDNSVLVGSELIFELGIFRNAPSGKLLKEILTSTEIKHGLVKSGGEEDSVIESVFLHNNKAVDLLLGEDEKLYLDESLNSSPDSSIVSEPGDPLHDDTLLKDLFYTTPVSYKALHYKCFTLLDTLSVIISFSGLWDSVSH